MRRALHQAQLGLLGEEELPERARLLHNLAKALFKLGRREEALEAAEEALRTLAPFFLRLLQAFAPWMRGMLGNYRQLCRETGKEPDMALVVQIAAVLQNL